MSWLDDHLRPVAQDLISRHGTEMTLKKKGVPTYDPASGTVTETAEETSLSGVIEDVDVAHPDGVVRRGDRMVTVAAGDISADPSPGDEVEIKGEAFQVISVASSFAGDRPAIHRLHVRR